MLQKYLVTGASPTGTSYTYAFCCTHRPSSRAIRQKSPVATASPTGSSYNYTCLLLYTPPRAMLQKYLVTTGSSYTCAFCCAHRPGSRAMLQKYMVTAASAAGSSYSYDGHHTNTMSRGQIYYNGTFCRFFGPMQQQPEPQPQPQLQPQPQPAATARAATARATARATAATATATAKRMYQTDKAS